MRTTWKGCRNKTICDITFLNILTQRQIWQQWSVVWVLKNLQGGWLVGYASHLLQSLLVYFIHDQVVIFFVCLFFKVMLRHYDTIFCFDAWCAGMLWEWFVQQWGDTSIFLPVVVMASHVHTPPLSLLYHLSGINWTSWIKTNNKSPSDFFPIVSFFLFHFFFNLLVVMHFLGSPALNIDTVYQSFEMSLLFTIRVSDATSALILCFISVLACQLVLYRTDFS